VESEESEAAARTFLIIPPKVGGTGNGVMTADSRRRGAYNSDSGLPGGGRVFVRAKDFCIDTTGSYPAYVPKRATHSALSIPGNTVSASGNVPVLTVANFTMVGCTFNVDSGKNASLVQDIDVLYPTWDPIAWAMEAGPREHNGANSTRFSAKFGRIERVRIRLSTGSGVKIEGTNNTAVDVLVDGVDSIGTLTQPALAAGSGGTQILHATARFFGNAGIVVDNGGNRVGYSHAHHGGLIGLDSALVYTGSCLDRNTTFDHIWAHHAREKCIRFDDQSRHVTVHHCVAFDCGEPLSDKSVAGFSLVLKGDYHYMYANTLFSSSVTDFDSPSCPEPSKPWGPHRQPSLPHQNNETQVFNSAFLSAASLSGCEKNYTGPPGGNFSHIAKLSLQQMQLEGPYPPAFNFTPMAGSPLVDAGEVYAPYTDGFVGSAPDVGAYERGGEAWVAGCRVSQWGAWREWDA